MSWTDIDASGEMDSMFSGTLLSSLVLSDYKEASFSPAITLQSPGDGLVVRPLARSDYNKGFIDLLKQLTVVGDISHDDFLGRFESMRGCAGTYYPVVVEDEVEGRLVGAASLVVEQKFIHGCSVRGRLEDVVVSDLYRGKQLGKLLIVTITLLARSLGCYKITLDCKDEMIPFYSKVGYSSEVGRANYMTVRFD